MKKLLASALKEGGCAGAFFEIIVMIAVYVALNFISVSLIIWLLHFVLTNPLIVPIKTKWIITAIFIILEWMFK